MKFWTQLLLLVFGAGSVGVAPRIARADETVTYLYNDASGTPVVAADATGGVLWRRHFTPFGEEDSSEGTSVERLARTRRGFTGHVYDRDTGLVYMGSRYYHPGFGTFFGPDSAPVNPGVPASLNRYAYGNQNPYSYMDENGDLPFVIPVAIWAVGAAWTAYDTYQAYQSGGVAEVAQSLAVDAAVTLVAGGVGKVAAKVAKPLIKAGKGKIDDAWRAVKARMNKPKATACKGNACLDPCPLSFINGTLVSTAPGTHRSIETLEVGQRVVTAVDRSSRESEWWVEMHGVPGSSAEGTTIRGLRSSEWMRLHNVSRVGQWLTFESAAEGHANPERHHLVLRAIEPVPATTRRPEVFNRLTNRTMQARRMYFEGKQEAISTDADHELFSHDRGAWTSVDDLNVGEKVVGLEGLETVAAIDAVESGGSYETYGTHSAPYPLVADSKLPIRTGLPNWAHGGSETAVGDGYVRIVLRSETEATRPSADVLEMTILRPAEWALARGLRDPGDKIDLQNPEIGASSSFVALAIDPAEIPASGPGQVILGTYRHVSGDVYGVSFVGGGEPLRGTGSHPLFSLDRDDWVRVRDLQVGERLQTAEGAVTVEALEKVRGVHRVYNLEVEGDHEYLVGEAEVRAHNTCAGTGKYSSVGGHHVHAKAGFKGHATYSKSKGFAIGQDYMKSRGWSHADMTRKQRELFDQLAAGGGPNTLKEHSRIAVESLIAGGASRAEARSLVAESLRNLRAQGVRAPSHIPWN